MTHLPDIHLLQLRSGLLVSKIEAFLDSNTRGKDYYKVLSFYEYYKDSLGKKPNSSREISNFQLDGFDSTSVVGTKENKKRFAGSCFCF